MDLPANREIEAAVVARLLVDPRQIGLIAGELDPADLSDPELRAAYRSMIDLSRNQRPIDIQTLADDLGETTQAVGRLVTEASRYTAPLEEYARILRGYAFRRRLITRLERVNQKAAVEEDQNDLLAELHQAVTAINTGISTDRLIDPQRAAELYALELEQRRVGKRGLSYGLPSLDRLLIPAAPGDMIVVAARPSVGKTAFAEQTAERWAAESGKPILFASLEMSLSRLLDRSMARAAQINSEQIIRGLLSDDQYRLLSETAAARKSVGVWYLDDPNATTGTLRTAAAQVQLMGGAIAGIVVDYLQLLRDAGDQEVQRVTRISRAIKGLALEYKCPVLALSQLSRASELREDKRPRLHDLRESGAIEQDADTVIAIWPDEVGYHHFSILKQRQGVRGTEAELIFDGSHIEFTEA